MGKYGFRLLLVALASFALNLTFTVNAFVARGLDRSFDGQSQSNFFERGFQNVNDRNNVPFTGNNAMGSSQHGYGQGSQSQQSNTRSYTRTYSRQKRYANTDIDVAEQRVRRQAAPTDPPVSWNFHPESRGPTPSFNPTGPNSPVVISGGSQGAAQAMQPVGRVESPVHIIGDPPYQVKAPDQVTWLSKQQTAVNSGPTMPERATIGPDVNTASLMQGPSNVHSLPRMNDPTKAIIDSFFPQMQQRPSKPKVPNSNTGPSGDLGAPTVSPPGLQMQHAHMEPSHNFGVQSGPAFAGDGNRLKNDMHSSASHRSGFHPQSQASLKRTDSPMLHHGNHESQNMPPKHSATNNNQQISHTKQSTDPNRRHQHTGHTNTHMGFGTKTPQTTFGPYISPVGMPTTISPMHGNRNRGISGTLKPLHQMRRGFPPTKIKHRIGGDDRRDARRRRKPSRPSRLQSSASSRTKAQLGVSISPEFMNLPPQVADLFPANYQPELQPTVHQQSSSGMVHGQSNVRDANLGDGFQTKTVNPIHQSHTSLNTMKTIPSPNFPVAGGDVYQQIQGLTIKDLAKSNFTTDQIIKALARNIKSPDVAVAPPSAIIGNQPQQLSNGKLFESPHNFHTVNSQRPTSMHDQFNHLGNSQNQLQTQTNLIENRSFGRPHHNNQIGHSRKQTGNRLDDRNGRPSWGTKQENHQAINQNNTTSNKRQEIPLKTQLSAQTQRSPLKSIEGVSVERWFFPGMSDIFSSLVSTTPKPSTVRPLQQVEQRVQPFKTRQRPTIRQNTQPPTTRPTSFVEMLPTAPTARPRPFVERLPTAPTVRPRPFVERLPTVPPARPRLPVERLPPAPPARPRLPVERLPTAPPARPRLPVERLLTAPTARPRPFVERLPTAPTARPRPFVERLPTAPTARPRPFVERLPTAPTVQPRPFVERLPTAPTARPRPFVERLPTAPTVQPRPFVERLPTAPTARPRPPVERLPTAPPARPRLPVERLPAATTTRPRLPVARLPVATTARPRPPAARPPTAPPTRPRGPLAARLPPATVARPRQPVSQPRKPSRAPSRTSVGRLQKAPRARPTPSVGRRQRPTQRMPSRNGRRPSGKGRARPQTHRRFKTAGRHPASRPVNINASINKLNTQNSTTLKNETKIKQRKLNITKETRIINRPLGPPVNAKTDALLTQLVKELRKTSATPAPANQDINTKLTQILELLKTNSNPQPTKVLNTGTTTPPFDIMQLLALQQMGDMQPMPQMGMLPSMPPQMGGMPSMIPGPVESPSMLNNAGQLTPMEMLMSNMMQGNASQPNPPAVGNMGMAPLFPGFMAVQNSTAMQGQGNFNAPMMHMLMSQFAQSNNENNNNNNHGCRCFPKLLGCPNDMIPRRGRGVRGKPCKKGKIRCCDDN